LSLDVAEEILYSDSPSVAARLVTYYSEVIAPNVRSIKAEGRVIESRYATVLGLLEERRGNRARAGEAYRHAFETIRSTGLMRGAAIVAYRLFSLTGEKQYADFVTEALRDASDKYWVKARLAKSQSQARLTPRQRQAVQLVAKGMTDKEIGAALGIKYSRARNIVAAARETLDVHSRAELIIVAAACGLLPE
jgi:DNA-binding CsgD family transcriptional regulator